MISDDSVDSIYKTIKQDYKSEFFVGDTVCITGPGHAYSGYVAWAVRHGLKYFKKGINPSDGDMGIVTVKAPHLTSGKMIYAVHVGAKDKQIIIGPKGLTLVASGNGESPQLVVGLGAWQPREVDNG